MNRIVTPQPILPAQVPLPIKQAQESEIAPAKTWNQVYFQAKLTVGSPDDPLEKEADDTAERVVGMFERSLSQQPYSQGGSQVQRDESTKTPTAQESLSQQADKTFNAKELSLQLTAPNFLSMRQPFFKRNVLHLWDSDSALEVWNFNKIFFNRLGFDGDLSAKAANLTAPFFIDAQLKADNPTWWEITDRDLNTSSFVASIPIFDFDAGFRNWRPLPFLQPKLIDSSKSPALNFLQRKCAHCEEEEQAQRKPLLNAITPFIQTKSGGSLSQTSDDVSQSIQSSRGGGSTMDNQTRSFMSERFGSDFSGVNIHTDANAVQLSQTLNAHAFTVGNDIYFNQGQYRPETKDGKFLLAHELTHTLQQGGSSPIQKKESIQRTTVGSVLNEFFSPFSDPTLWNMPESDNYTNIVRSWQPVIDGLISIKADITSNCANWAATHRTDTSWRPGMTKPPVTDPNSFPKWVSSPPGTDPETCKSAFILYVGTMIPGPAIQSFGLYTCSIGSFGLYVTVDAIDCAAQTATIQVWMYNTMDKASFGKFASHPAFSFCGMEPQYMWWNWDEQINWAGPTGTVTAPESPRDTW
ncbi:hypothetical protein ACVWYG_000066 [Pedobacter sp. UYEF25]